MKTKSVAFLALVLGLSCVQAADDLKKLTGTWETQVRSKYMGKIGIVFYERPVMVNDITVSYGDWYVGAWNSTGISDDRYGSTFADEQDIYAGWGHTYGWIRLQAMAAVFLIKDLDVLKNDIWVYEGEASFPKVPIVQPYVAVRAFNQVSSESPENGLFLWMGLRRSQALGIKYADRDLKLNLDLMTGYTDGALKKTSGFVMERLTMSLPIILSDHWTVTPTFMYQMPFGNQYRAAYPSTTKNEAVGIISAKYTF